MARSDLERQLDSGDWNPAWFLDHSRDESFGVEWDALGLPRAKRELANRVLRKLFPPDVVRRMAETPIESASLFPLFPAFTMPTQVVDLLDLGINAEKVAAWDESSLVRRLMLRNQHDATAFEIAVAAAAVRGGVRIQRVAEASQKTYDFNLVHKGRPYAVEVKLIGSPNLDRYRAHLNRHLGFAGLIVPGFESIIRGSRLLNEMAQDDLRTLVAREPELVAAFKAAGVAANAAGKPGIYAAGDWGEVEVLANGEPSRAQNLLLPPVAPEFHTLRIVRTVERALGQLTSDRRGIIVLGLFGSADHEVAEQAIMAAEKLVQDLARECVMVVLCDSYDENSETAHVPSRHPFFHAFSPLLTRPLERSEVQLAQILASTHWARALRVDASGSSKVVKSRSVNRAPGFGLPVTLTLAPGGSASLTIANIGGRLVTTTP